MTAILVGNAPVSWGVYEADRDNPPFGVVLDAIAAAGYEGTELGPYGYLPVDAKALDRELRTRKLALGSSFVCLPLGDGARRQASIEQALRVGKLLATQKVEEVIIADEGSEARRAIAGRVPQDGSAGWSDRQWAAALETLQELGRTLKKKLGMRVVVHHHAGTHFETPAEIDRLLAGTDSELCGLLLDTGHLVYGGGDPLQLLAQHGRRVRYVHYKDVDKMMLQQVRGSELHMDEAWKRGVFCALGDGMVDFPSCTDQLRALGYKGWIIVEQDVVPDVNGHLEPEPTASAAKSRRFLRDACGL
jgi:inosose dehydratase